MPAIIAGRHKDEDDVVVFRWSRHLGDCYDCGAPAAFYLVDDRNPNSIEDHRRRCSVCAASAAADGETIAWISRPE